MTLVFFDLLCKYSYFSMKKQVSKLSKLV
jgi:hypothetical protein